MDRRRASRLAAWAVAGAAWAVVAPGCRPSPDRAPADDATLKSSVTELQLVDLVGVPQPLVDRGASATVVVVTRTDCPIAQRYAPTLVRLQESFATTGVALRLAYVVASETDEEVARHVEEFGLPADCVFRDPASQLVGALGASVTPEAFVFDARGELQYQGRIDDRYVDFGKARAEPASDDLARAAAAAAAGETPSPGRTKAIGCYLPTPKRAAWEGSP